MPNDRERSQQVDNILRAVAGEYPATNNPYLRYALYDGPDKHELIEELLKSKDSFFYLPKAAKDGILDLDVLHNTEEGLRGILKRNPSLEAEYVSALRRALAKVSDSFDGLPDDWVMKMGFAVIQSA